MSRANEEPKRLQRLVTVSTTPTLTTGALRYPRTRSLHLIPRSISKKPRKSHDGFEGHDGHDGHDGLTRFFTPRQAEKGSILQETFLVADTRVQVVLGIHSSLPAAQTYGLQRCLLDNVHSCRQPSGWKSSVQGNLELWTKGPMM